MATRTDDRVRDSDNLHTILYRMVASQAARDAARPVSAPLVCGDARLHGSHLWTKGDRTLTGTLLSCPCGARGREGFEGDVFAEYGFGPPPVVVATERAA